jgi:hypothetical protein
MQILTGFNCLRGTNTLAYLPGESVTKKKSCNIGSTEKERVACQT